MFREKCRVLENKKIGSACFVMKLASARISKNARPGQFVQIACADSYEPLLPRPFSFLTASRRDFSVLYQAVGKGTKILSRATKGDSLWILGPLGNGFSIGATRRVAPTIVLVGGGVGIPPLYHLAKTLLQRTRSHRLRVFLGARHKDLLLCEKDFKKLGADLKIATDDGSKGRKGLVTALLEEFLRRSEPRNARLFTCGPTPMLKAVSTLANKFEVPCEVSVEVPMACGIGACLGCAVKLKSQNSKAKEPKAEHRFAMACSEGPVFQAQDIIWD